jgi:putative PIN family toxin of toxin-antitoxin system
VSIVVDTNVLVSGLLRTGSPPAAVLDLVFSRQLRLAFDERIFAEYVDVLARPEFEFPFEDVHAILDFLWREGERVRPESLALRLPDPDDAMFLEVAVSAAASALVSGNLRHYPLVQRRGVRVMTPREYVAAWADGRG